MKLAKKIQNFQLLKQRTLFGYGRSSIQKIRIIENKRECVSNIEF